MADKLKLIEPSAFYEKEHKEMLNEWHRTGEKPVPFVLDYDSSDFKKYVEMLHGFKYGIGIPEEFVPHSTFWLINNEERILGVMNLRHRLSERLLLVGGHIGYGIRPSERRNGYATKILELGLIEAKKLGINKVLVTCSKNNLASSKTILKNNGKFYRENLVNGIYVHSFWIEN